MRNWADVLPEEVAVRQTVYERRMRALRARKLGFTYKQIGEIFGGVTAQTARGLVARAEQHTGRAPICVYYDKPPVLLAEGIGISRMKSL